MKRLLWLVLATCSIIATASVGAHEGATGIVAERMAAMKETAAQMKALDRALKAGSSVTPDMIASAEKIAAQAHSLSGLFPARSGGGHSEARAEVWTRREAFEKAMQAFAADSEKLVSAARFGDYTETRRQFREVANQCLGCHEKFRTKDH
jgi:cytochrome c556